VSSIALPFPQSATKSIRDFAFSWFVFFFFLTGIAAYNVGPIPVPWIAQAGMIGVAVVIILYTQSVRSVPGLPVLLLFTALALLATAMHAGEFSGAMPAKATLPYWAYVLIRYVNVFSFAAALYVTYWLCGEGKSGHLLRWVVWCGLIISAISLYIYLAHILGLPEPPRNRLGTGGGEQATSFSSIGFSYERAVGTFREPSGLAEWLILPLFCAFRYSGRRRRLYVGIILLTLLLTVSMTGVFSVAAGTLISLLITKPFSRRTYKIVGGAVLGTAVILLLLTQLSVGVFAEQKVNLTLVIYSRAFNTVSGGIGGSNRAYVYDFVADHPWPFFGLGMGNANILAAQVTGNQSVVSLLSLYLFVLYAAGYPGMLVVIAFLVRPIVEYARGIRGYKAAPVLLMAYIAYLVSASVGAEEFTPFFGVATGLLIFEARQLATAVREWRIRSGRDARAFPEPALST
jgi:hypothetical protein